MHDRVELDALSLRTSEELLISGDDRDPHPVRRAEDVDAVQRDLAVIDGRRAWSGPVAGRR
jgi:hypothetical protein